MEKNQLKRIYGETALEDALKEIKQLAEHSNFTFDKEYIEVGIGFTLMHAAEILEGRENKCSLKALITKSFGEAAIYKFNVCGD